MVDRDHTDPGGTGTLQEDDMQVIQISIKQVYGSSLYYPANEAAQIFARIAGKKTFKKADLNDMKQLGFQIEYVNAYAAEEV